MEPGLSLLVQQEVRNRLPPEGKDLTATLWCNRRMAGHVVKSLEALKQGAPGARTTARKGTGSAQGAKGP